MDQKKELIAALQAFQKATDKLNEVWGNTHWQRQPQLTDEIGRKAIETGDKPVLTKIKQFYELHD